MSDDTITATRTPEGDAIVIGERTFSVSAALRPGVAELPETFAVREIEEGYEWPDRTRTLNLFGGESIFRAREDKVVQARRHATLGLISIRSREVSSIGTIEHPTNGGKAWIASHGEEARPAYEFWDRGAKGSGFIVPPNLTLGDLFTYGWTEAKSRGREVKYYIACIFLGIQDGKFYYLYIGDESHKEAVAKRRELLRSIAPASKAQEIASRLEAARAEVVRLEKELEEAAS